ncbi:19970_t:CDS:2 [Funneliformis geosporum]|uniref:17206_t:CDS:1 n=1 Tax=Funneliformis geosporum TaxID=1117311 RepID=A0A9W4WLA4_9GLOM|nr:17206_t:CDS:2 [Funneliformis geosporum]CAI2176865.1 19970_t:CDS:2 [Funneliformis geosporum]
MNSDSGYWDDLKNDNFGETLDERFLYILCNDYERYEDMVVSNKLNKEVNAEFYQERLDALLESKKIQLDKLIQIHAKEIVEHRKIFYQSVDLRYVKRKYSTTDTLSSIIFHPEVEKILINGRDSNPSQHGIADQGNGKIGTMEDVADAIKRKLTIKDDEPIIGRDELYLQYYAELDQIKERQEKELQDYLAFYKREQEYFERCMIKVKKHDEIAFSAVSSSNDDSSNNNLGIMKFRAEYNSRPIVQDDKRNPHKKSKVTFVTLDSDPTIVKVETASLELNLG